MTSSRLTNKPIGNVVASAVLLWVCAISVAEDVPSGTDGIRVLSWNISEDAFIAEQDAFSALVSWANPDVLLLDEVSPAADPNVLEELLNGLQPGVEASWHVDVGPSGGRQRGLIASRAPLGAVQEFAALIPYPEADRRYLLNVMPPQDRANRDWSMDGGIPVHGALLTIDDRRLLVVIADLQCCGDGPDSWQEYRRRVESREIRRLIARVVESNAVDGVILAGDFNMVNSTFPMTLLTGPYPMPHPGLIPVELYHPDGKNTWTWDGRRTPFPSNTLDYQFYGPHGLKVLSGFILDTEDVTDAVRDRFGLDTDTATKTGRHRPLLVEYDWR